MFLTSGAKLGPHEIQNSTRARVAWAKSIARDTRLDPVVGIKILSEYQPQNPQAREPFADLEDLASPRQIDSNTIPQALYCSRLLHAQPSPAGLC
jgi:hypothetical protein